MRSIPHLNLTQKLSSRDEFKMIRSIERKHTCGDLETSVEKKNENKKNHLASCFVDYNCRNVVSLPRAAKKCPNDPLSGQLK